MPVSFSQLGNYGRLGNQLFQIAATIGLALDNNDIFIFPPWKYEQYFNLHGCFYNKINFKYIYNEPAFYYKKIKYENSLDLRGYFQSIKYFENHGDYIYDVLNPNYFIGDMQPWLKYSKGTSIHVRRTDYLVFSDSHTVLGMEYYNKAMELCPSDIYFIFSDDIEWCKRNFIGDKFVFVEGNHETLDLKLMSLCGNNIIANSSFSWWGAFLNGNEKRKVIAPKNWFGPNLSKTHKTFDLFLPEWILI